MLELLDELYNSMNGLDEEMLMNNLYIQNDLLATDIYETKDNYVLEIEVPGYDKENVTLDVKNGILSVVVKSGKNEHKHHFLRKERNNKFYFERRYDIGSSYTNDDVQAKMENGLLTVLLPKEVKKITDKKYINIK